MDTVYPQPVKLLRLGSTPRRRRGDQDRYRTQPVTFSEIKVSFSSLLKILYMLILDPEDRSVTSQIGQSYKTD